MPTFNKDIVALTKANTNFRQVILTGKHSQIAIMCVEPGDDIGEETHHVDQVLVFVEGEGEAVVGGETTKVAANSLVVVPAETIHNFINTGAGPLKLYTVYSPPEEPEGLVHKDKAEAEAWEKEHHHS